MTAYNDKLTATVDALYNLLLKKHHDYGEDNLRQFGAYGILVRCSDKLARLRNIICDGAQVQDETIRDTWLDLAGYAIQAVIMMDQDGDT